ncbi:CHAP domain-containing protein [Oscillibacter sp.]|uniref:CHAP domain-containing protein n=1 Tax=Oscillibacter sp. TaxID=1945593 RepID=UPI00289AD673|nr:CHAP domain-containing protein [Oscillibacter sp.]
MQKLKTAVAIEPQRFCLVEVGGVESPAGSNKIKYNTWYYGREVSGDAYPWCVVFARRCCAQSGVSLPVKTASCTALMNAAKMAGMWVTSGYLPGDIVIFDWGGDKIPDHCGIIAQITATGYLCIEGNTAVGNDSNGGEVMERTRAAKTILGAVRFCMRWSCRSLCSGPWTAVSCRGMPLAI